jgi:hypothetical protein
MSWANSSQCTFSEVLAFLVRSLAAIQRLLITAAPARNNLDVPVCSLGSAGDHACPN